MKELSLVLLPDHLAIIQLSPNENPPIGWDLDSSFTALISTADEKTIICAESRIFRECKVDTGWRVLKVDAILDFSLVGILAKISDVLARVNISIFVVSSYNTDYILVKEKSIIQAIYALRGAEYQVIEKG